MDVFVYFHRNIDFLRSLTIAGVFADIIIII